MSYMSALKAGILLSLIVVGTFFALYVLFRGVSVKRAAGVFTLFVGVLYLTYFPFLHGYYVYHDDYYFWAWTRGDCSTHPQYEWSRMLARPIVNLVMCALGSLIERVQDANTARCRHGNRPRQQ